MPTFTEREATRPSWARLLGVAVALGTTAAAACPVCGYGQQESEFAYIGMTAVLSLLPLAMMAAVAGWLFRRAKLSEQADASKPEPMRGEG